MPTLAGWLTGEQVPQEIIEQTLLAMGEVLGQHGGEQARTVMPGAGLIAFSDTAYAMQHNDDPPVLDWVPNSRTMVYRRPLSGIHQLYYIENWPAQGNLLFASEIKALLAVGAPRKLHLAAIDALLRYGFIPAPWTAFKDIHVVPAGSILRWQRAKTIVNQSTDYHFDEPLAESDTLEQLHSLLNEATAGMLPPHNQIVALTDGSSSSALPVALANQHITTPFSVATLGYTKSTTSKAWKQAESLAEAYKSPFLTITGVDQPDFWTATLAGLEGPCGDTRPLALHQLLHTTSVETQARIAITGLGTHALLNTIASKLTKPASSETKELDMLKWYAQTLSARSSKPVSRLWSKDASAIIQKDTSWEDTRHARKLARRASHFADKRQGWYYLDLHLRMPDYTVTPAQQLATQERMALRTPYLNSRVIDMLVRLPNVLDDGTAKDALITKLAQRFLPNISTSASRLHLSAPASSLLRIADSEVLQQTLSPEALQATGIFNVQEVTELLEQNGDKIVLRELLTVFTTQLLHYLYGLEI